MKYIFNTNKATMIGIHFIGVLLFIMGIGLLLIDCYHVAVKQHDFQVLDIETSKEIINYFLISFLSFFFFIIYSQKLSALPSLGYAFISSWIVTKLNIVQNFDNLVLFPEQTEHLNIKEILEIFYFHPFLSLPILLVIFVSLTFLVYKRSQTLLPMIIILIGTILVHNVAYFILERNTTISLLTSSKEKVMNYQNSSGQRVMCETSGFYCFQEKEGKYYYILNQTENFNLRQELQKHLKENKEQAIKVDGKYVLVYKFDRLTVFVNNIYVNDSTKIMYQLGILINLLGLGLLYTIRKRNGN